MNRLLFFGVFAGTAAWLLTWDSRKRLRKVVPIGEAAAKLQQAWADHHTRA